MMPSRYTPAGTPEITTEGNSGNPATSQKLSNSTATQVRNMASDKSSLLDSSVTTTRLQVANTDVGQPPSVASGSTGDQGGSSGTGSNSGGASGFAGSENFRSSKNPNNPSRGFEDDEDRPATMSVTANDGSSVLSAYASFLLQNVSESEQEKYQVVETFTSYYAFFFGKHPPTYRFSGFLINDPLNNWMNDFRYLYENYFRGTAAAELNSQVFINYDKRVVSGFLLSLSIQQDAITNKGVPFTFDMLVINHSLVGFSTDFEKFISDQQASLADLKKKAAADSANLSKNPDGVQAILKSSVLQGALPAALAAKTGEVKIENPLTQKAVLTTSQAKQADLVQQAVSIETFGK